MIKFYKKCLLTVGAVVLAGGFSLDATAQFVTDERPVQIDRPVIAIPENDEDVTVIWSESFEDATTELPDGWFAGKADNTQGNNVAPSEEGEAQWFLYSDETVTDFNPTYVRTGDASVFVTWNVQAIGNAYLTTPEVELPEAESLEFSFWHWFGHSADDGWFTIQTVLIETESGISTLGRLDGEQLGDNIFDAPVTFDITEYAESTVRFHIIQEWSDGFQTAVDDFSVTGTGVVTSTEVEQMAEGFELSQNYPNPFNPTTNISYTVPQTSQVTIEVFNMLGQKVATLVDGVVSAGSHTAVFDAANLTSGMYIYRMNAGSFTQTQKMMLVK